MSGEWWKRSKPEEMTARPWLHPEVTRYLEKLVRPEYRVLEHGSGGSTLWLAARAEHVISVEADFEWYQAVNSLAPANVTLMFCQNFPHLVGAFDLVLIDGEPVEQRIAYIEAVRRLVKPGGWVVLDNANRPEYAEQREQMLCDGVEYWVTFNMNMPGTKFLVTEFYKLRGGLQG